jgi:hypothetical protein
MDSSWDKQHRFSINPKRIGLWAMGGLTCLVGVLIATNPRQDAYERYATERLTTFLNGQVCAKAAKAFGLNQDCQSLLDSNRPQIRNLIADNTQHHNFVLFSVYTTELSVASFLPKYRVQTVGVFDQFFIYDAVQE